MDFEKYLNKEHIEKVVKTSGFPNPVLVELLIQDYRVFLELLKRSNRFILKGGSAAQLYLRSGEQRASIDIDLVTDLTEEEVEKIMIELGAKLHVPIRSKEDLPLKTYKLEIKSVINQKSSVIKIDVLFEKLQDYKIVSFGQVDLFAMRLDEKIPVISKGSLIADKLLTLARKSVGIRDEEKIKEIPKHIYDLIKLSKNMSAEDISDLIYSFERIAKSEIRYRGLTYSTSEIITHIEETLIELCKIDVKENDIKTNLNRFTSAYIGKTSRPTIEDWIVGGLKLRYLINQFRLTIENARSQEDIIRNVNMLDTEIKSIGEMDLNRKKGLREKLIEEARDKLPNWKNLLSKTEQRICLELKLVTSDTVGHFSKFVVWVLNKEKFEKITNFSDQDREKLKNLLKSFFERTIDLRELIRKMIQSFPQKKPYLCEFIANTEISKILSLARMAELKSRKEIYCYVELSENADICADCRSSINGRVFKVETLEKNIYANYGKESGAPYKPTVPLHPNCNHKIRALLPSEKKRIKDVTDTGFNIDFNKK